MENILKKSRFENIFGINLAAPQNVIFSSMLNLNYAKFRVPRGGGKDLLLAMYAMLYAELEPKSRILMTTPTTRQARMAFSLLDVVRSTSDNKYFKDAVYSFRQDVKFKNGSRIDVGTKYDDNSDVVLVNEADTMPEEQLSKLVLGVENGDLKKVFLMSAGYYDYNYMNKIEAHECFSAHAFGYKSFPSGFYDQENIDEAKKLLSADEFDMEYNAKVVSLVFQERSEDAKAT